MTEAALAGIRVLDLSWVVAGPAVGRVLADYGAEVIRVESATRLDTSRFMGPFHGGTPGPESSALYGDVNAGKLGLTLDLKTEAARDVVRDLVRRSDVVIESFSPGVMERWGLGYQQLRSLNQGVVMLRTSLLGQNGPHGTLAGYGNIGAALSGFHSLIGWLDRPPFGPYGPYSDYVAPRFGLVAVLAALDRRLDTGEGCCIDLAQAEAAAHFLAPQIADYRASGRVAERAGNRDPAMAPHGVYPTADGSWVAIAVRDDREGRALAGCMEAPGLAADGRYATAADRLARAGELDETVAAWTGLRKAADVEALLQAHGIPAHEAISSATAIRDRQFVARGHFVELDHPIHGRTAVQASRFQLSETPARVDRAAPTLGQDTDQVLRQILGYDDARVERLRAIGALT